MLQSIAACMLLLQALDDKAANTSVLVLCSSAFTAPTLLH